AEEITLTIGQAFDLAYRKFLESGGKDVETRKQIAGLQKRAGSVTPKLPSTDIFDMIPFSPISPQSSVPTHNGMQPPPVPSRSNEIKRDLFGAEPFDPFNCGAGDFPPDIQSKLDEMQVTILTDWPIVLFFFFTPLWFLDNVIYYILCDFPYYSRCNNTSLS
ncbi:hypothetical protein FD755_007857, partial [Muntiacus reevesi]